MYIIVIKSQLVSSLITMDYIPDIYLIAFISCFSDCLKDGHQGSLRNLRPFSAILGESQKKVILYSPFELQSRYMKNLIPLNLEMAMQHYDGSV